MKRRHWLPVLLVLALVLSAGIGSAWAYFTTYASAQGGIELHLGTRREFEESFQSWTKTLTVHNNADSAEPIYVRARVFWPEKLYVGPERTAIELTCDIGGEGWSGSGDYYYFENPVQPGQSANVLTVKINGLPEKGSDDFAKLQEGDAFNVIVVYESIPVQYAPNGDRIAPTDADWTRLLDNGTTTATEGGDNP